MGSKGYIGKACAYCAREGCSTTADHVVPRAAFLIQDRGNLPQVPACRKCNNEKSKLEHYALATLLVGSRHVEADRYRREMIRPRLARDRRLAREIGLTKPPQWMRINGVLQPMHAVKVDAAKLNTLHAMIVKGLYHHHFGEPLHPDWTAEAQMKHPAHEAAFVAAIADILTRDTEQVEGNLGRGAFVYEGLRSRAHRPFSVWRFAWHGGIRLHGSGAPSSGVSNWWGVTRPTPEAVARAEAGIKGGADV